MAATYKNINLGTINADNVHIGDITYIIEDKSLVIPFHLTNFIPSNAAHVVGREAELQATREKLLTGKPTVLVNGIGGIGKTTLALKYMVAYTPQYQHLAWLNAAAINGEPLSDWNSEACHCIRTGCPAESPDNVNVAFCGN